MSSWNACKGLVVPIRYRQLGGCSFIAVAALLGA
jgi:hypothetical protein